MTINYEGIHVEVEVLEWDPFEVYIVSAHDVEGHQDDRHLTDAEAMEYINSIPELFEAEARRQTEDCKIGARVRIDEKSDFFEDQGHHGSGEIIAKDVQDWYLVKFDDGYDNLYPAEVLIEGLPRTIDRRHEDRRKGDRRKQ